MKLFLIIWAGGSIGGVVGPLPYEMALCQKRADGMYEQVEKQLASGRYVDGTVIADNPEVAEHARRMRFTCEYRDQPPQVGETP